MSYRQRHPRQSNARRAPVARHVGKKSVGTDKPQSNDFENPSAPLRAQQQAAIYNNSGGKV